MPLSRTDLRSRPVDDIAAVEEKLARLAARRVCIFTGRATAALYLALSIVRERSGPGEVVLPAITCPSVVQAVLYARMSPVFVDVAVPDCTLDLEALRGVVGPLTRAIVPIHIFGHLAPVAEIAAFGRERGITVIEDAAQAIGGTFAGSPIGSFGDFSLFSFGSGKVADAGGGGCLLTNDVEAAARVRELHAQLPQLPPPPQAALLALSERNLQHALTDALRADPQTCVAGAFRAAVPMYRPLHVYQASVDESQVTRILSVLGDLGENVQRRAAIAGRYAGELSKLGSVVQLPQRVEGAVSWRYSFFIRDSGCTVEVTRALRAAGIHASNHYWSAAALYEDRRLPNAEFASARLLNLWVDRSTDPSSVLAAVVILREVLH